MIHCVIEEMHNFTSLHKSALTNRGNNNQSLILPATRHVIGPENLVNTNYLDLNVC